MAKGSNKGSQQSSAHSSGKAMAVSVSHQSRTSYMNSSTTLSSAFAMAKGSNKGSRQSSAHSSGKAMAVSVSHQSRTSYMNSGTALSSAFAMVKGSNKGSQQSSAHSSGKAMAVSVSHQSRTSYMNSGTALSKPVEQPKAYQKTTWVKHEDKQTGCYGRFTAKEKALAGERHVERGSGKVGVRDEFTKSSTVRVGNKSGYTEYHTIERVRDVKFDGSSTKAPKAIAYH